jgi:hypothetical protein
MEIGFAAQVLSDSVKVSPLMQYRPCESGILTITLDSGGGVIILHMPPLTRIVIPTLSMQLTEMRVNAILGAYRMFLSRTLVCSDPFGNSIIMSPSPMALTGHPSAVWISLGGMSWKVVKCFCDGKKCRLAPQSINVPRWSLGMLSALATSTKYDVHTKATSTFDNSVVAVFAFSVFPFAFAFFACCFGPWPSFLLPGLQQSSFQCPGLPQLKHFFLSLLVAEEHAS